MMIQHTIVPEYIAVGFMVVISILMSLYWLIAGWLYFRRPKEGQNQDERFGFVIGIVVAVVGFWGLARHYWG